VNKLLYDLYDQHEEDDKQRDKDRGKRR